MANILAPLNTRSTIAAGPPDGSCRRYALRGQMLDNIQAILQLSAEIEYNFKQKPYTMFHVEFHEKLTLGTWSNKQIINTQFIKCPPRNTVNGANVLVSVSEAVPAQCGQWWPWNHAVDWSRLRRNAIALSWGAPYILWHWQCTMDTIPKLLYSAVKK